MPRSEDFKELNVKAMRRYSFTNAPPLCWAETRGFSWSLVCRHICNVLLLMNSHRYQCSVTAFSPCYLLHMHLHKNDRLLSVFIYCVLLRAQEPCPITEWLLIMHLLFACVTWIFWWWLHYLISQKIIPWSFEDWELFIWLNVCCVQWSIC